jgi:hypothetical protein
LYHNDRNLDDDSMVMMTTMMMMMMKMMMWPVVTCAGAERARDVRGGHQAGTTAPLLIKVAHAFGACGAC